MKKSREIKLFKVLTVHALSLCLLFTPLSLQAAGGTFLEGAMSALEGAAQMAIQAKQQQAMIAQQNQMSQMLQPKTMPAEHFTHCQISAAGASIPKGACKPTGVPEMDAQNATFIQGIAQKNIDFYTQLLDESQHSMAQNGLACINRAKIEVQTSIDKRKNALEDLKTNIIKANQMFEEQNKELLDDLKRTHAELNGGGGLDMNQKAAEYEKLVTPQCRDIIGTSQFKSYIETGGFIGIRDRVLKDVNQKAVNHNTNVSSYKKDLRDQINDMSEHIGRYGIESLLSLGEGFPFAKNGQEKFGSMNAAFLEEGKKQAIRIMSLKDNIKKEVGGTNVDLDGLMKLDNQFDSRFPNFLKQAESLLKREAITQCVSGNSVSMSTDQILASLRYKSSHMSGTSIDDYRTALKNILDDSDTSAHDKAQQIKALGDSEIAAVYNDENSRHKIESPYVLFQKIIQKCEQVFVQENDRNLSQSYKKRIARAKSYMQELAQIESTFMSDFSNHLINEVENCSGREIKAGQCNSEAFNTSSAGFCIDQASTCAANVNHCYGQIGNEIQKRQAHMNTLAATYNNNMSALITQQEALLTRVKQQVKRDAAFLQSIFPGAVLETPEELLVKMPLPTDFLGVQLRGGGDLDALKTLPDQITKLQYALQDQWDGPKGVEKKIEEYKSRIAKGMQKNLKDWSKVVGECKSVEKAAVAQANQINEAQQKAFAEKNDMLNNYCQRFDDLRQNPMAGCSEGYDLQGLYEDGMKIGSHINDDAQRYVGTFKAICAQSQNQSDNQESADEEDAENKIAEDCEDKDSDEVLKELAASLKKHGNLSSDDIDIIKDLEDDAAFKKLAKESKSNSTVYNAIEKLRKLYKQDRETRDEYEKYFSENNQNLIGQVKDTVAKKEDETKNEIVSEALKQAKKIEDQGFCSSTKITSLLESVQKQETSANIKFEDKIKNSKEMKSLGRTIASLEGSPNENHLSRMGQSEYADIDCNATASKSRGGGMFDFESFDRSVLGRNNSLGGAR